VSLDGAWLTYKGLPWPQRDRNRLHRATKTRRTGKPINPQNPGGSAVRVMRLARLEPRGAVGLRAPPAAAWRLCEQVPSQLTPYFLH
jgi:hypothetical protein